MHQTVLASLLMMAGMASTEERRIDPFDGQKCTLDEVKKKLSLSAASEMMILNYWESEMIRIVYSESDPQHQPSAASSSSSAAADAPPLRDLRRKFEDWKRLVRFRNLVAADNSKQDAIKPKNPPPDEMRENPQDAA